jgi:cytochrome P450
MTLFDRIPNPFAPLLALLPTPRNAQFFLARARLFRTIQRMIEERRADGGDRGDLLSMLLDAQDQEDGRGMSDKQVRDEALTLFLAGHETTSNALMWTWYLLSQHPEAEAKLHAELDEALGGAVPTAADVPRLEYTRRVFAESMRLYPPAHVIGRTPINDFKLGPYLIQKGYPVLLSPYIVHRDPRFHPEPERFHPDRWAAEGSTERPKFTYFPFGGGPRTCIGEGFAWMEGILVIATLAQRWQMRLEPGHPIELLPLITLRSKHGMRMTLLRRRPAPVAVTAV